MSKKNVKLEIVYLPVDALEEYEGNARDHGEEDVKAIQRSIEKFGFDDPIGIWSDHNVIVEGHGRLMAAKALGMKEVPCIRLDHMTDAERKAYGLAHNKTAELSRWNFGKLEMELSGLGEFNMGDFGFGFSNGSSDFGVVTNPEDEYGGDDDASMAANNTSCFNYRVIAGSTTLSYHAQGLAIDINPRYNPYVTFAADGSAQISPENGVPYADREMFFPMKIDRNDLCYQLFTAHGFEWGGDWDTPLDYQHFEKPVS